jgi:signal transduction histidine kinase
MPETTAPAAPPRSRWIEFTAQLAEHGGNSVRYIEFTARARQVAPGRWLWDGIATDVTPQKRAEAELRASREELRELASHQARVREEERAAIAREIHDDIGSTLTGVKFDLAWLKEKLARDDTYRSHLEQMDQLVDSVITSSTRIMHNLRPGILDEGIVAALEWLARNFEGRTGVTCTFDCVDEDIPLEPDSAIVVFRICQEALNNIAKHAGATVAGVTLEVVGDRLVLEVRDDGCGVTPADLVKRDRFGLRGMRERAIALGGSVEVASAPRGGTVVRLRLPLAEEPAKSRTGPQLAA